MRTTLSIDEDLLARLRDEARVRQLPMRVVVNEALRRGLLLAREAARRPIKVRVHQARLLPGVDPAGFNKLVDELEDEARLGRLPPLA